MSQWGSQGGPPPGYQGPPQGYGPAPGQGAQQGQPMAPYGQQGYPPQQYPQQQGYGYGPPASQPLVIVQQINAAPGPTVIIQRARFNHTLHLVITICTCGLWLPVWILLALLH